MGLRSSVPVVLTQCSQGEKEHTSKALQKKGKKQKKECLKQPTQTTVKPRPFFVKTCNVWKALPLKWGNAEQEHSAATAAEEHARLALEAKKAERVKRQSRNNTLPAQWLWGL